MPISDQMEVDENDSNFINCNGFKSSNVIPADAPAKDVGAPVEVPSIKSPERIPTTMEIINGDVSSVSPMKLNNSTVTSTKLTDCNQAATKRNRDDLNSLCPSNLESSKSQ